MANDGKFVLDGKRVEFSDYRGSSKVGADDRLDTIEAEIRVLQYSAGKMNEWLSRAEHRVNELQEKIDAID